jgi:hypothetical protein
MAKREFTGSPLDFTMKSIGEEKGESLSGSSDDDLYDEKTEILPKHIDGGSLNQDVWEIVNWYLANADRENPDFNKIAENVDSSTTTVKRWIHKIFQNDRGIDDVSDGKKLGIAILSHHGLDCDVGKIQEDYPISEATIRNTKKTYPDLVKEFEGEFDKNDLDEASEAYKSTNSYKMAASKKDSRSNKSATSSNSGIEKSELDCPKQAVNTSDTTLEILGRYCVLGQELDEISNEMGVKKSKVNGSLSLQNKIPESEWIIPDMNEHSDESDSQGGNRERNGVTSLSLQDQKEYLQGLDKPESEYVRNLIQMDREKNLTNRTKSDGFIALDSCDCDTPKLSVERATAGSSMLQVLSCETCGFEFKNMVSQTE